MKIEPISSAQLPSIYAASFTRDFPPDELMPLQRMLALTRQGSQQTLGIYENAALAAYAVLVLSPEPAALLNYFAVEPTCRGQGVGTRSLALLKEAAQSLRLPYILFEVETPASARTPEELATRRRRVAFYLRGGAKPAGVDSWLYGVDYHIMLLPALDTDPCPQDVEVKAQLESLYLTALTEAPAPGVTIRDVSRVFIPQTDPCGYARGLSNI